MKRFSLSISILAIVLFACEVSAIPPAVPVVTMTASPLPSTYTPIPSLTPTPMPTRRPSLTPITTPTFTPAPYEQYTISSLRSRTYGGGQIELTAKMDENKLFKRYSFTYPSDGLNIYGFMNVPQGQGAFPVIIMIHGKADLATYSTLDYSTPYADRLASAGYIVLHPNLRNYPPSDTGDNLYRVGMAIDILNLIALVKTTGGLSGPLAKADPASIGLWGHSMGGGIVLRTITVSTDVKAALLYAPLSGDEKLNFEGFFDGPDNPQADIESQTNPIAWFHISPFYSFNNITAAVSIHQGRKDDTVLPEWTDVTCQRLRALGKTVYCVDYPEMNHAFSGLEDRRFITLSIIFFNVYLKDQKAP
jgi:dipeptidyl aminopeptidase/acylaminoacyl peptidase